MQRSKPKAMHSDGLSIPWSHSALAKSTVQRGGRGARASSCIHILRVLCLFVVFYSLFTIRIPLHFTQLQMYIEAGRERNSGQRRRSWRLSQTDPGELATLSALWGRSLSPAPAMLPSSSLSPGRGPWMGKATWGELPSQGSWSWRDSWAPLQSLRLFRKGCSVHGSSPHYISFFFFLGSFALFQFFFASFPK